MSVLEGIRRPKKSNKVSPQLRAFTNVLIFFSEWSNFPRTRTKRKRFFLRSFLRNFTLGFSLCCYFFVFNRYKGTKKNGNNKKKSKNT